MRNTVPFIDLIGRKFIINARGPETFDCYGLVIEMNRRAGIVVPEISSPAEQAAMATTVEEHLPEWIPCEPVAGAMVVFQIGRHVSHVGYLLDADRMIHAWEPAGGVCVERFDQWKSRARGYYRYVGSAA